MSYNCGCRSCNKPSGPPVHRSVEAIDALWLAITRAVSQKDAGAALAYAEALKALGIQA